MGASKGTELQIFAGGLNLMPASHLIKQEESRVFANTNARKLNLSPLLASLFVEQADDHFVFFFQNTYEYYAKYRSNVLYNDVWYWSEIGALGKKYSDGTDLPLGIAPPIDRLTISETTPTVGDGLTGNINYVYTYYDPESGSESPPSPPSVTLDLTGINAGKSILIDDIVPSPDGYESRLYRIGGIITAYSAVVTLEPSELTYTDELSFSEIQAIVLSTLRAYPPPTGLMYLTEHQGRFYGAVGSKLFFSAPAKPDSWYTLDFISFEETIKGIASVANGLIVMTNDKCWLITGISPIQFTKHTLSESEGCVSFASIATNEGTAIWLSASGFVMSNGGKVTNLSVDKLGRFKTMTPLGAAFIDKRYFMSFGGVLYPSHNLFPSNDLYPGAVVNESGIALPPGAVLIDLSMGAPSFATIIDNTMGQLMLADNELFHISAKEPVSSNLVLEDDTANIVTENGFYNIVGDTETGATLQKTLRSNELRELRYLSPVLTEGSIGTLKQYEKVRIMYSGELDITIMDEDSRVFVQTRLTSVRRVSVWVNIPVGFNHGYGIQFAIRGRCIVDSVYYTWTPKEIQ